MAAVTSIVGQAPTKIYGANFLNDGQPVDCIYRFDGGAGKKFDFVVLEQAQYGRYSDYVDENGVLDPNVGVPVDRTRGRRLLGDG